MYNLPYFKDGEPDLQAFMEAHPFAFLIGCAGQRAVATQVPLLVEKRGDQIVLEGHLMRRQDHHLAFAQNPEVLVVFTGPHTYVSATWYDDPHQASTWNYMSVHARGTITFLQEEELRELLQKQSLHFEGGRTDSSTVYRNLPGEYTDRLIGAITGFSIAVREIDHVFKLSQNRNAPSYHSVMGHLGAQPGPGREIADQMARRAAHLYPGWQPPATGAASQDGQQP
ncbi:MAG TPA: FMN-binding negative transcriptional regulator [Chitinophagaceae bacterium]|nr:FMN-binding negative transcriptional regulator [Chitinophagaceae bacterium]